MTAALDVAAAVVGLVVGWLLLPVIEHVPARERPWPPSRPSFVWRDVMVEVGAAALFAGAAARFGAVWVMPAFCVFFAGLLALSVIDLDHFLLPNRVLYPTLIGVAPFLVAAAATTTHGWHRLGDAAIAGAVGFAVLGVVHFAYPRGMGFGDVRLAGLIGLLSGWLGYRYAVLALFLGFFMASIIGLLLIATRLRSRKDAIPFGPFMAAGAVFATLWGQSIVGTYANTRF